MSHTLTSHAIQKMSSQTVSCPLSNICVEFRRSSRHAVAAMGEQKRIMTYAIIRGKNGRRHEVDFGDAPVRVEVHASEATIEIFVEADFESLPEKRRRFALINVPRQEFSQATGEAARRAARKDR
jgi:hypothetical protein